MSGAAVADVWLVRAAARAIKQRRPVLPELAPAAELAGPLLNVTAAARLLGVKRDVVAHACDQGRLRFVMRGGQRLMVRREVEEWVIDYRREKPGGGWAYRARAQERAARARALSARGVGREEIARQLGVSLHTVERYLGLRQDGAA
jgi:excisionase family DNA binding protein